MRSRRRAFGCLPTFAAAIVLLAAACSPGRSKTGPPGAEADGLPVGFFERPLGELGTEVTDIATARLPFRPVVPDRLGPPAHVYVSIPPEGEDPRSAEVAWVFELPQVGRLVLLEIPDDVTEQGLRAEASPVPSPGCTASEVEAPSGERATLARCAYGMASLTTLASGRVALVIHGDRVTGVEWIEPLVPAEGATQLDCEGWNLSVRIMGPAQELTVDEAVTLANQLATPAEPPEGGAA
jgi:hypothetical protein